MAMGEDIVQLLSETQLEQAAVFYNRATIAPMKCYTMSWTHLQQAWLNHWQRVLRMPAGGAHAGGAMQTGFEMELISAKSIRHVCDR